MKHNFYIGGELRVTCGSLDSVCKLCRNIAVLRSEWGIVEVVIADAF